MSTCIKCGTPLSDDTKFCVNCGTPVDATQTQQQYQQPPYQQQPYQQNQKYDPQRDIADNKGMAVLAYFIFFIPLLAAPQSRFAKYHTNQGLLIALAYVAVSIFMVIPFIGWFIGPFLYIAVAVLHILGIVNAAKGEFKPIPLIGSIIIIK